MDERLVKIENETDFEYYQRLGLMKLNKEVDLEWDELAEIISNNTDIEESGTHYRKKMYGIKECTTYYEDKINKLNDEYYYKLKRMRDKVDEEIEDKRVKEIKNKVLQLEKEKLKLRDQRNDLNAIKRTMARKEHLVECMKDDIDKINKSKPLIKDEIVTEINDTDGIILLSDMHLGAYTDNMLDKYNPNIAKDKLNYYIDRVIGKITKENIQKVYFLVAGDLMSGIIHNTTRYSNRLNASEQVIFASELLSEAINKVSNHANVCVGILTGNHDRIVADKQEHMEDENFVEFIREMVRLRLISNKRVTVVEPQDSTLLSLEIRGKKIAVVHGNLDRKRTVDRLIEMNYEVYDYILQGHYHRFTIEQHNHTTIITNGAFGGEEYGKNARLYNKAEQLFMTIDDNGISDITPINLDLYNK